MKKVVKKGLSVLMVFVFGCATVITIYGASAGISTYSSTYEITGGIFTQKSFKVKKYCKIEISPEYGATDCNMSLYTADKILLGWKVSDSIGDVSSTKFSSTTCRKTGTYGIYLRNWSGIKSKGKLFLSYK